MTDSSFEDFVAVALPGLSRYARALTGDSHGAEDLVQDTLVKVARAWRRVRTDGNPHGYATTTMFRTYVSLLRTRRRQPPPLVLLDDPVAPVDSYAQVDARLAVRHALAELPRLQRAVLVASYLEETTDEEIAELIGRTPSTVRSLRRRGLQALRASLGPTAKELRPTAKELGPTAREFGPTAKEFGPVVMEKAGVVLVAQEGSTHGPR